MDEFVHSTVTANTPSRLTRKERSTWRDLREWLALIKSHGLLGLALATMIALLSTNHWYMVWRGINRLRIPLAEYLRDVVVPAVIWSSAALVLAGITAMAFKEASDLMKLGAAATAVGIVFVLALFRLVMTQNERASVRNKVSATFARFLPAR